MVCGYTVKSGHVAIALATNLDCWRRFVNHFRQHGQYSVFSKPLALLSLTALTITLPCLTAGPAQAKGFLDPITRPIARFGKDLGRGIGHAGRNIGEKWHGTKPKHPYRVTFSRFLPSDSSLAHGAGNFGSLDVDYDLLDNQILGGPSVVSLYGQSNDANRFGRNSSAQYDASLLGVGIQARRLFGRPKSSRQFYAGFGFGLYRIDYTIDPTGPSRDEKVASGFGTKLFGGYQFSDRFFGELELISTNSFHIRNANGTSTQVAPTGTVIGIGYRF